MTIDTRPSPRPHRSRFAAKFGLAACFAAVLLGAGAGTAQASHGERDGGRIVFRSGGIGMTWGDWAPRPRELPIRGGMRFQAPPWSRHVNLSPAADFERGLAAGWQLGERVGYQDGFAGRAQCLEVADNQLPRARCSTAYLEGFRKGYRKGYHQGHYDGRQARNNQHCH